MKYVLTLVFPIELENEDEATECIQNMVDWAVREIKFHEHEIPVQGYVIDVPE